MRREGKGGRRRHIGRAEASRREEVSLRRRRQFPEGALYKGPANKPSDYGRRFGDRQKKKKETKGYRIWNTGQTKGGVRETS